jgi:glycosyltransferase involved in cell wall biosynthesis
MTGRNYPLVSIGIPTYNRAGSYLKQAIESARSQTYPNIEIIISDNCSSDDTEEVVGSFSDSRIRYYRQEINIGPNNNFNFCLNQARGDYFLLFQDDDLIDDDFIECCMKSASYATNLGVLRTGTRIIDANGDIMLECPNMVKGLDFEDFVLGWFRHETAWYLCSTLYNTEALKAIGGFNSKHNLLQDGMATARLAAKHGRSDVEDIKASFRKHGAEITFAVDVKNWVEDFIDLLDLLSELATERNEIIRSKGERFFSQLNYNRAQAVKPFFKRCLAYITVYKSFDYRYLPPPVKRLIFQNPLYLFLRERLRKN